MTIHRTPCQLKCFAGHMHEQNSPGFGTARYDRGKDLLRQFACACVCKMEAIICTAKITAGLQKLATGRHVGILCLHADARESSLIQDIPGQASLVNLGDSVYQHRQHLDACALGLHQSAVHNLTMCWCDGITVMLPHILLLEWSWSPAMSRSCLSSSQGQEVVQGLLNLP